MRISPIPSTHKKTRREFLARDREKFPSISDFETKSRIVIQTILTRIHENLICCLQLDWCFSKKRANNFLVFLKIITCFIGKIEQNSDFSRREWDIFLSISCFMTRARISFFNIVFQEKNEKKKIISNGRARKIKLILTRIPRIDYSRWTLFWSMT